MDCQTSAILADWGLDHSLISFGLFTKLFYATTIHTTTIRATTIRSQAGGGIFYNGDTYKPYAGILATGYWKNKVMENETSTNSGAYFSGEFGVDAELTSLSSFFLVGNLIFDTREFTIHAGVNFY